MSAAVGGRRLVPLAVASLGVLSLGCVGHPPTPPDAPGYVQEETLETVRLAVAETPEERIDLLLEGAERRLQRLREVLGRDAARAHAAPVAESYRLLIAGGLIPALEGASTPVGALRAVEARMSRHLPQVVAMRVAASGGAREALWGTQAAAEEARDRARRAISSRR